MFHSKETMAKDGGKKIMASQMLLLLIAALAVNSVASKSCDQLLPGLQRMSRGIDITSLDLFPTDISLVNGFRQPLFDFTCDSGAKWRHPTVPNFEFPVPDQISAVNTVPGGEMNHKISYHEQINEYKKSLGVQVGLDVNTLAYGDYSLSVGYQKAQQEIMIHNRTVVEVAAYASAIQMDFKPYYELKASKNFEDYVSKQLPEKYEQGPEKYQEFLNTFGTHYFESGMFGGYMLQRTVLNNDYLYRSSDQEISANIEAAYLQMIKFKVAPDHKTHKTSETFDRNSLTSYYYYGGQTNLAGEMTEKKFSEWWDSVPKDPWLFGGRIKPIQNLIANDKVKSEMTRAIGVKMARAYLQEAKTTLGMINKGADVMAEIDDLLRAQVPDQSMLEQIKKQVDSLVLQAQDEKQRAYLRQIDAQLDGVLNYELFCKRAVTEKCDQEKNREVMEQVKSAEEMRHRIAQMLGSSKAVGHEQSRRVMENAAELVHFEQTVGLGKCRELLICNICKAVIIDIVKRKPCDTTHIKQLVDVHV